MSNLYQLYAFVTAKGWESSLSERWPDAPLVGDYRLLVFTNEDLPRLKQEYSKATFKEFKSARIIKAINNNEIGPFVCDLTQTKKVINHFTPETEETPLN